ncbi:serine hydrolase domain-containing protein [Nocardioides coralli]|uniref:serine hydrolase domain-containing protein n=1 Tax=Nocardioides coralli TaxID=2872154 RepID=UPI001CA3C51F|nr:serine hydrolase domain-containing protein [Nocardioides coralli]QZY28700.1 beta-lactamase family protein [Nocardioides coralli]
MDVEGLQRALEELAGRRWFQGAVALSGPDGGVVEAAVGLADLEVGRLFTPTTPADTGSVAKTFTAALVWQAHDEGALDVTEPVATYLPGLPSELTVLDLLTHRTGGLPDYGWYFSRLPEGECLTNRHLHELTVAGGWTPERDRDDCFDYDSTGYDLAALVVERALDTSYADLLASRVTQPLGMAGTFVRPARVADWPGERARGYRPTPEGWEEHDIEDGEGFHGGSNVWSSARDLHHWGRSLLEADRFPVSGRTLARAAQPVDYPSGATGRLDQLSWYVSGGGTTRHYPGVLQGFFAVVLVDRATRCCVGLTSTSDTPHGLRWPLVRMLRHVAAGGPAVPPEPPSDVVGGQELVGHLGTYGGDETDVSLVLDGSDRVRFRPAGGPAYQVFPLDETTWYVPGLDHYLSFTAKGRLRLDTADGLRVLERDRSRPV